MIRYYSKLIRRNKLVNFWLFSGNDLKNVCPLNYKFIFCLQKKSVLFDFTNFILIVKKIFPVFFSIADNKGKFLFIGSKQVYLQTAVEKKNILVSNLEKMNIGVFSNLTLRGYTLVRHLKLETPPSIAIFFNIVSIDLLLVEIKKKEIPIIGFVDSGINHSLIDYPIFLNSLFFYNIYLFSRFFFRQVVKLI